MRHRPGACETLGGSPKHPHAPHYKQDATARCAVNLNFLQQEIIRGFPFDTTASSSTRRIVVIHQNAVGRALHVLKLPAAQRPPEYGAYGEYQHEGKGNQQVENIHGMAILNAAPH